MYITISAQQMGGTYNSSVRDYVNYLEKENEGRDVLTQEHFFDQYNDKVHPDKVISEIDGNTAKLHKKDPKFYSIVVSPSAKELKHIHNDVALLKKYTREIMKDYAASFHRDRKVSVDDIKYYAKIEHERSYRGFEKKVKENAPYRKQIAKLQNDITKINRGDIRGNVKSVQRQIDKLFHEAPHKIDGKLVTEGMKKEGMQTHIHIIVSRKDVSNKHSLSPGSKFKKNTTRLNGKKEKQGFHRDKFFEAAERKFDKLFEYNRNLIEKYHSKKLFRSDPKKFFALVAGLPTKEKELALKLLHKLGAPISGKGAAETLFRSAGLNVQNIPTSKVQLALKAFNKLKKGLEKGIQSGSIGV